MSKKITIDDLENHLNEYSAHLQKFSNESSADPESQLLFDELAKYHHYIIQEIIEYLGQM